MENLTTTKQNKASIFIIDDAPWHNILCKKMLAEKYSVKAFTDVHFLLDSLKDKQPHLIISDIDMPELSGYELCQRIKDLPGCSDIPVIHVSSMDEQVCSEKSKANGAAGFMQKPLKKEPFLDIVAQKM